MDELPSTIPIDSINTLISWIKSTDSSIRDENLSIASSNELSVVLLFTGLNKVYQYYSSKEVMRNIWKICELLLTHNKTNLKLYLSTGFGKRLSVQLDTTLSYNTFDYIVEPFYSIPDLNTIVWERITPLNSISSISDEREEMKELVSFLEKNYIKLLWDISKALNSLHSLGIIHGDCRIDNIGFNNKGNFVLFDFDGSKMGESNKDYIDLKNSLKFVTGIEIGYIPYAKNIVEKNGLENLEKLKIKK